MKMSKAIVTENSRCVNPFHAFKRKVYAMAAHCEVPVKVKCKVLDTEKGTMYVAFLDGDGRTVKIVSNPSTMNCRVFYGAHVAVI